VNQFGRSVTDFGITAQGDHRISNKAAASSNETLFKTAAKALIFGAGCSQHRSEQSRPPVSL
jgi:hypothetical protein